MILIPQLGLQTTTFWAPKLRNRSFKLGEIAVASSRSAQREDVQVHVKPLYSQILLTNTTFVPTAPSLLCAGGLAHFLMIYIHYREHSYTSVTGMFILFLLQLGLR